METNVNQGIALRYRVLRSDRASHGCPSAGSMVYPSSPELVCALSDSEDCIFIACSLNRSGFPYFTIARSDVESMFVQEDPAATADAEENSPVNRIEPRSSQPTADSPGHHSVCQFFQDGTYEWVKRSVGLADAAAAALRFSSNVSAGIGLTSRVIITDADDCTNWDWCYGEGVRLPQDADCTHPRLMSG